MSMCSFSPQCQLILCMSWFIIISESLIGRLSAVGRRLDLKCDRVHPTRASCWRIHPGEIPWDHAIWQLELVTCSDWNGGLWTLHYQSPNFYVTETSSCGSRELVPQISELHKLCLAPRLHLAQQVFADWDPSQSWILHSRLQALLFGLHFLGLVQIKSLTKLHFLEMRSYDQEPVPRRPPLNLACTAVPIIPSRKPCWSCWCLLLGGAFFLWSWALWLQ